MINVLFGVCVDIVSILSEHFKFSRYDRGWQLYQAEFHFKVLLLPRWLVTISRVSESKTHCISWLDYIMRIHLWNGTWRRVRVVLCSISCGESWRLSLLCQLRWDEENCKQKSNGSSSWRGVLSKLLNLLQRNRFRWERRLELIYLPYAFLCVILFNVSQRACSHSVQSDS